MASKHQETMERWTMRIRHWTLTTAAPGTYTVDGGASNVARLFALPLTDAANYIAELSSHRADLYTDMNVGDMTPTLAVRIRTVWDLRRLTRRARQIDSKLQEYSLAVVG